MYLLAMRVSSIRVCILAFPVFCIQLSNMALPVHSQFGWEFEDVRERVDYRFNFRSGAHSPRTYDFVYQDCVCIL